jgi:NADPH:quinone reductase-like Zn-dependent oxidoreductase
MAATLPPDMLAAYVTELGPPSNIEVGSLPLPVMGADEVLVRTEALGVNHVDTFIRSGAYATDMSFPFVVGRDLVGTVVDVGKDVGDFAPGQRVWCNSLGFDGRPGSFSEYCSAPAERLYHLPAGADPADAVAVLHTAATACIGLRREARIRAGDTIVVNGAGGGVGSAVVQIAGDLGARVIATTTGAANIDWCYSCGAEHVLDYRVAGLPQRIQELAPAGVQVYWENATEPDLPGIIPLLAKGGRMIVVAGLRARPTLPLGDLYIRDASIRGFAITNASIADLHDASAVINDCLAGKRLVARIEPRLRLGDTRKAHELIEGQGGRRPTGRLVIEL